MVQGKTERAIQTFKRAANLMPSVANPAVKLAALLLQANRRSEAEQTLTEYSQKRAVLNARQPVGVTGFGDSQSNLVVLDAVDHQRFKALPSSGLKRS
jgi:hypothetical protein